MPLTPGAKLGPYEVKQLLGTGGMSEVYQAHDTRLGRDVAIKILPESFSSDRERLQRFEREARLASSLNHPNIITIHEIGQSGSLSYIVMELIDGKTLRQILDGEPIPIRKWLDLSIQLAEALAKALEAGVVHRDLKPENVMLTNDGYVKVLDFGIAKLAFGQPEGKEPGNGAQNLKTAEGILVGTVSYMSPEQAKGESVDYRSDQFSLGTILYEMGTGKKAFHRESPVQTLMAILQEEPESIETANPELPQAFRRIITRCLAKDSTERYGSTWDLVLELKQIRDHVSGASAIVPEVSKPRAPVRRTWKLLVASIFLMIVGFALGVFLFKMRSASIDSVAVLPFAGVGVDAETEYLSEGITESVINNLSQIRQLRVMARSTVFRYKGREVDPQKVGRELRVRSVLTGRLSLRGDTVMIGTELIDVADGAQIWGKQYHRKLSDLLALQQEISRDISEEMRLHLTGEQEKRLTKLYTENMEAYRLYMKGRYYWNKRTGEGVRRAIEYFKQAIDKDPNYALAYAGLADCYNLLHFYAGFPANETFPKAKAAAMKALELDESLAEAHTSLAYVKAWFDWDFAGAEEGFLRAIELNPNYATAHHWRSELLQIRGKPNESILEARRAQELDPLSLIINLRLGDSYRFMRKEDEAIRQFHKILEMESNFGMAYMLLGKTYVQKGMFDKAIEQFQMGRRLADVPEFNAWIGYAYAMSGRKNEAEKMLTELRTLSEQNAGKQSSPAFIFAILYYGLGQENTALEWLEKTYKTLVRGAGL